MQESNNAVATGMPDLFPTVLEGGASNQVQRIIGQNFFLKLDINFIRPFFYQTQFQPINKTSI
jgi:hypothetical protein